MGEEPGWRLLHSPDWLVLKSYWQQSPAESGVRPQGQGIPVVLLAFGQQVTDLLLELWTDGVLGQNQNAQAGRVVLDHVQENLHRGTSEHLSPCADDVTVAVAQLIQNQPGGAGSPAGQTV